MDENELIAKAQKGDKASLAKLVKSYEQTIYNFAYKVCRNRERAENTMQETFLKMVKNLDQFSGKSKLSTWLYSIVSNNCLMMIRSDKSKKFSFAKDETDWENNFKTFDWNFQPEKITENNELKKVLDDSIEKLPQDYKVVFLLRDVEGLSTEETGKATNLSVPAVKSRLHRARAFLRNEISEKLNYENI